MLLPSNVPLIRIPFVCLLLVRVVVDRGQQIAVVRISSFWAASFHSMALALLDRHGLPVFKFVPESIYLGLIAAGILNSDDKHEAARQTDRQTSE